MLILLKMTHSDDSITSTNLFIQFIKLTTNLKLYSIYCFHTSGVSKNLANIDNKKYMLVQAADKCLKKVVSIISPGFNNFI